MTGFLNQWTARGLALALILAVAPAWGKEDARVEYARQLLQAKGAAGVATAVDESLGNPEGFVLSVEGGKVKITGGGPAGVLYGVDEYLDHDGKVESMKSNPDFELRGSVLFLMKEASYDYRLLPSEFPWFYDRELLTKYFDYLQDNRFNAVFLWTGNLFANIVEMPEYPDASDLTKEQLLQNQEQFRWFTSECAKRNISVLLHFYNIHLPVAFAKTRHIPIHYSAPDEFAAKYLRYSLGRFLSEFDSVGLYVCPGEVLNAKYTPEWIRDVIFKAANDSGKHPVIVIRDWGLDSKGFRERASSSYDNAYTELKHNIEMIVSPVPDERHKEWIGVAKKHIVNVHEVADVKPFRWGSPAFIHEMVANWKEIGINGAEVYGMISWRWPNSLDKLTPEQKGFWPEGPRLLTFERDAIWLAAIGRYLWHVDRDPAAERKYWINYLGEKFGNQDAGEYLVDWYQTTGPILPGLQNLTSVANMNFHPTVIGKEQYVDDILNARSWGDHQGTGNHPSRPVDTLFFERYQKEYNQPGMTDRMTLSVAETADRIAKGQSLEGRMTPEKVLALMVKMAGESVEQARKAQGAATTNKEEAARFVTDSQALLLVVKAWQCKVMAAQNKALWEATGKDQYKAEFMQQMEASIPVYEQLVALTDKTYVNPTDMVMWLNWHEYGLSNFQRDLTLQKQKMEIAEIQKKPGFVWVDTEGMQGDDWKVGANYAGYFGKGFRASNSTPRHDGMLTGTAPVKEAGTYTVWTYGLAERRVDRSFAVEVGGTKLPRTHDTRNERGARFVWVKAGTVELPAGDAQLVITDAGDGYECPDVVLLARDAQWDPRPEEVRAR